MTNIQQRAELQRRIWQIANDVRGTVDGWDFKQYVLGTLFYRFISENFAAYIEGGDDSVNYAELPDRVITLDIEASANGYPSEQDIKGLFADFDTTSNRFGNTVKDKNLRLAAVLKGVADLDFGDFDASHIDLFGDAYEFLISNYAANAGKSGGEFFTPQHVSKLIAQLPCTSKPALTRFTTRPVALAPCCCKPKNTLTPTSLKTGFGARRSTTPPTTWRG
jgi:type I restriction enzyme M protein